MVSFPFLSYLNKLRRTVKRVKGVLGVVERRGRGEREGWVVDGVSGGEVRGEKGEWLKGMAKGILLSLLT